METVSLEVQKRDKQLKAKDLLRENLVPAEYYGHGVENKSFQIDYQSFRKAYRESGNSTIIELKLDGNESLNVLVHDVQYDPVTDLFTHIDFINVKMGEEIHTKVPLEFVGTSLAVKDDQGTLITYISELDIKCLPKDLLHSIEVSIDSLVDFNTHISVQDLVIPEGITVLNAPEDTVASVSPPRAEEAEPAVDEESAEAAPEAGAAEKTETSE
jgi:large subunit ribosomal protein L25